MPSNLMHRRIRVSGLGSITVLQIAGCVVFVILMLSIGWLLGALYMLGVLR